MDINELYPAIEAANNALGPIYFPAYEKASQRARLSRIEAGILSAIPTFEPNPVSAQLLNIRTPYAPASHFNALLESLTDKGMLKEQDEGKYYINRAGMAVIKDIMSTVFAAISGIQTMPVPEMQELANRLKVLSDACYHAPEPPGKWCILHSRRLDPGLQAPAMVRIDQYLSELAAFRDDAHLAAWSNYETNGHAWDILTLLWLEDALMPVAINDKLRRRGNSLEDTRIAIDHLVAEGYATWDDPVVSITPTGIRIRNKAEETTNLYYYTPFKKLDSVYLERTLDLINLHRRGIPKV